MFSIFLSSFCCCIVLYTVGWTNNRNLVLVNRDKHFSLLHWSRSWSGFLPKCNQLWTWPRPILIKSSHNFLSILFHNIIIVEVKIEKIVLPLQQVEEYRRRLWPMAVDVVLLLDCPLNIHWLRVEDYESRKSCLVLVGIHKVFGLWRVVLVVNECHEGWLNVMYRPYLILEQLLTRCNVRNTLQLYIPPIKWFMLSTLSLYWTFILFLSRLNCLEEKVSVKDTFYNLLKDFSSCWLTVTVKDVFSPSIAYYNKLWGL